MTARIIAIDGTRTQALPHPMLAAEHGGRLPAVRLPDGQLAPRDGLYRVRLRLDGTAAGNRPAEVALGTAVIDAAPRSLLRDWATGLAAVLVRESGF